jgi:hypothetical protein
MGPKYGIECGLVAHPQALQQLTIVRLFAVGRRHGEGQCVENSAIPIEAASLYSR